MRIRIEHDPESGCTGCPFYGPEPAWYDVEHICHFPDSPEGVSPRGPAPAWCPLRPSGNDEYSTPIIEVGAPDAWEREAREENDE